MIHIFVATIALLPTFHAAPAMAISIPGVTTGTTTINNNLGNSMLSQFAAGTISADEFTRRLTATGNIGQLDAMNLTTSIVRNATGNFGALGNVVNGVMNGTLNPAAALGLAGLPNIGNITNIQQLAQVANNPLIQNALRTALGNNNVAALTQQFAGIFGTAPGTQLAQQLLGNTALTQQLSTMLSSILGPQLTQMLGGITGIMNALNLGLNLNLSSLNANQALQALQQQQQQQQQNTNNNKNCAATCPGCCQCHVPIVQDHKNIRAHTTNQFEVFRTWLVAMWYTDNIVPALMVMTSQMSSAAYKQIEMLGGLFDAQHQLETQRMFQQMTALAHKEYHPSEGLCEFGTNVRSLAASERRADLSKVAFAQQMLKRSLKSGDVMSVEGSPSDRASRLQQFLDEYCDKNDNGKGPNDTGGLAVLCKKTIKPERQNKDIDFTRTLESKLSLDVDFTKPENTDDEKDIFALSSNLYAHNVPEKIGRTLLANDKGEVRPDGYPFYMDLRSLTAKRSVAQNSMAAIAAMKSRGAKDVAPFMKAFIRDLGLEETEIHKLIGEEPSYFAQMEVLTKKIYENPKFYTELYDKPANVERKIAVMEALEIMQDRDIFDSLLRAEAILAVYLESMLGPEQESVSNELRRITAGSTGALVKPEAEEATP